MLFANINQSALTIFWYFANVFLRANLGYGIITIGPAKINRSVLTVIKPWNPQQTPLFMRGHISIKWFLLLFPFIA